MGLLLGSGTLREQARANTREQFALGDFQGELSKAAARGLNSYSKMAMQVLGDRQKKEALAALLLDLVYDGLREGEAPR